MKILILGPFQLGKLKGCVEFQLVEDLKEADIVVISDDLKSYFLGTTIGETIQKAHVLEIERGTPRVISSGQFFKEFISADRPENYSRATV